MAKRKVNKSQAIRDYVTANPGSSAKEVVAALAKMKITVSAPTVATVKSKSGLAKSRKNGAMSYKKTNGELVSVDVLMEAKKLCAIAGSVESAVQAIHTIGKLEKLSS
ncbi:MAG: hypothetical protein AB8B55_19270 [Mariniblastus sp.]